MPNKAQEEIIGRAVVDPDFRKRLLADPEGTIASEGYSATPEFIAQLKAMDSEAAAAAAANLDEAFPQRKAAT